MISLNSFYFTKTYGGVYEGLPSKEQTLNVARQQLAKYWGGGHQVLLLEPDTDEHGMVPRFTCMAWLDGLTREPDDDGTHLFVIWFTDEYPKYSSEEPYFFTDIGHHIEKHGGWHKFAKGYEI